MSKLTMHSVIKKSNRISMKLSNVLGLNGVTVYIVFKSLNFEFDLSRFELALKSTSSHHLNSVDNYLL